MHNVPIEADTFDAPLMEVLKHELLKKLRRSIRLYIVGDIPKAFKYANKALSLDPDAVYTRLCRGVLNVHRGSLTDAFNDTRDALDLDPKSEIARKQMSSFLIVAAKKYFERRDFTKLYQTLLIAIGLNPNHFKSPAGLETFKVVRYIYRMTRDPQFNFPLAPTHQKILNQFFKKEGSIRQKFVLPPNYEDDEVSVAARISQARQVPVIVGFHCAGPAPAVSLPRAKKQNATRL
ncbi:hypothetical protein TNCV_4647111 [Trichonephila clavipes]|uniref:Uncharacterized protein n=1 Tax=Trichonephila clavipes TaxID=2585209 RepID=A0A8X6VRR8_TRICX|nr:hypothetical protein TNCV_4647111 [Trichonephila clavipes]